MSKLYVHKKYLKIYFSKLNYMEISGCPSIFCFLLQLPELWIGIWYYLVRCCIMVLIINQGSQYIYIPLKTSILTKCNIKTHLMQFSFISNTHTHFISFYWGNKLDTSADVTVIFSTSGLLHAQKGKLLKPGQSSTFFAGRRGSYTVTRLWLFSCGLLANDCIFLVLWSRSSPLSDKVPGSKKEI